MSTPLKDHDAVDRERREFKKKLKEFLEKEAELKDREKEAYDLVERSGILRELKKLAEAIRNCRTKIDQAGECLVNQNPADGTGGSHAFENEERIAYDNAKAELAKLLDDQRKEIERLTKMMTEVGEKTSVSPDDVEALDKAIQESMKRIGGHESTTVKMREKLDELKKQLKEHGDKGEVPKCGAVCKFPEHGLCDNPATHNGRCWIAEHQAQ
jgi:DNA repair ATPase RecN